MSFDKKIENNTLESGLLAVKEKDYGPNYKQHLLELYKLYVEMADNVSARRSRANTFFLSVNTLLVTAIGILSELQSGFETLNLWWVLVASFAGILFCWTWLSTINSYRQLNSGKFKVIHLIEERLPLAMYKAEWAYLKPKMGVSRYKQLTVVELWVPKIFAVVYLVLMIIAAILLVKSGSLGFLWELF
jgi:hypothetical protein